MLPLVNMHTLSLLILNVSRLLPHKAVVFHLRLRLFSPASHMFRNMYVDTHGESEGLTNLIPTATTSRSNSCSRTPNRDVDPIHAASPFESGTEPCRKAPVPALWRELLIAFIALRSNRLACGDPHSDAHDLAFRKFLHCQLLSRRPPSLGPRS